VSKVLSTAVAARSDFHLCTTASVRQKDSPQAVAPTSGLVGTSFDVPYNQFSPMSGTIQVPNLKSRNCISETL